jgi:hypothetical protein
MRGPKARKKNWERKAEAYIKEDEEVGAICLFWKRISMVVHCFYVNNGKSALVR